MKVVLVSPYPTPCSERTGMAWYAQCLVDSLPQDCDITVLADKNDRSEDENNDDRVKIRRCWDYNFMFPLQVSREVRRYNWTSFTSSMNCSSMGPV